MASPLKFFPLLLIFDFCCTSVFARPDSLYHLFNYTWLIINEAGDVANTMSRMAATLPWPDLYADLCALALSAGSVWGTPDHFMPRS